MHTHRRCRFRALSSSPVRIRRRRRRRLRPAAFPRRSLLRKFKEATTFQRPVSWFFPDHVPRSIFTGPFSLQDYVGASGLRRMVCIRTGDADFVHFLLLLYEFDVAVGGVFVPQRSRDDRSCANSRKRRLSSVRCHGFSDHVPRSIFTGPSSLQGYVGASGLRRMVSIRSEDADFVHFLLLLYGFDVDRGGVFILRRSRDDRSFQGSDDFSVSWFLRYLPVRFRFRVRRMVCMRTVGWSTLLEEASSSRSVPETIALAQIQGSDDFPASGVMVVPRPCSSVDIYWSVFASGLRRRFRVT